MNPITHRTPARRMLLTACAAVALLLAVSATGQGSSGNAVSYLTFNAPVSLPGVVLQPGVYTFEALRPDIVRVSSRDGLRVMYTGFTHAVPRPSTLSDHVFVTLGEAPAGQPIPITKWYPERGMGHQFIWR